MRNNSPQTNHKPGIQRYQFSSKIKKKYPQLADIPNIATNQLKLIPVFRRTEKKLKCKEKENS